jgi:hypothetical protein
MDFLAALFVDAVASIDGYVYSHWRTLWSQCFLVGALLLWVITASCTCGSWAPGPSLPWQGNRPCIRDKNGINRGDSQGNCPVRDEQSWAIIFSSNFVRSMKQSWMRGLFGSVGRLLIGAVSNSVLLERFHGRVHALVSNSFESFLLSQWSVCFWIRNDPTSMLPNQSSSRISLW